jgi:hypothetical protein
VQCQWKKIIMRDSRQILPNAVSHREQAEEHDKDQLHRPLIGLETCATMCVSRKNKTPPNGNPKINASYMPFVFLVAFFINAEVLPPFLIF